MATPPHRIDRATLALGVSHLVGNDARLARIVARHGPPPLWARPGGFRTLARIILEQQVSLRSAAQLSRRLQGSIAGGLSAGPVARIGSDGLRRLGVTRQKASYLAGLADEVVGGALDFRSLARLPDDVVFARLASLRGVGPWTAGIYLLMALGRADVWPRGDRALQVAIASARGSARVPSTDEAVRYAERWRPWRSVAARILWHGYLAERSRGG